MSHEWLEAIATAVSAFFAIVATVVAFIAIRRQDRLGLRHQALETQLSDEHKHLELRLSTERAELDNRLAKQREAFDKDLARTERLYCQRSALFDLWKYISNLDNINPKDPVTPDIMKAVNALELVALCCEGGIVDPDLVRRTFQNTYIVLYEQIEQVTDVPGLNKSGKKLLGENHAATQLYEEFRREIMRHGQLKQIGT